VRRFPSNEDVKEGYLLRSHYYIAIDKSSAHFKSELCQNGWRQTKTTAYEIFSIERKYIFVTYLFLFAGFADVLHPDSGCEYGFVDNVGVFAVRNIFLLRSDTGARLSTPVSH